MPYCLKRQRSVASEVRRLAEKQLGLAIAELRTIGDRRSDQRIHEARRHVKKVRAMLRLVQPAIGDRGHAINRRLRAASRLLGPIADGRAVVGTFLRAGHRDRAWQRTLQAIQAALVQRAARIDGQAERDRVLPIVTRLLRAERRRVAGWTLNAGGFDAVAPGLEKSVRRARKAMNRSLRHLSGHEYHVWRRRVKDLWFQVRLLEARCGDGLSDDERTLEALDDCLGEYHNVLLLQEILTTEGLVAQRHAARGLRLLRRYQAELRSRAASLGRRLFDDKPGHFVDRVERLWHASRAPRVGAARKSRWQRAA